MKSPLYRVLILLFGSFLSAQSPSFEQFVPENTYFVVNAPHFPQAVQAFQETWFGRVAVHPETKAYLAPILQEVQMGFQQLEAELHFSCSSFFQNVAGQTLFALNKFSTEGPKDTDALLVMEINNVAYTQELCQRLLQQIQKIDRQATLTEKNIAGIQATYVYDPKANLSLTLGILENRILLITLGEADSFEKTIQRYSQKEASLLQSPAYVETRKQLSTGQLAAMVYLNLENFLLDFSKHFSTGEQILFQEFKIAEIKAFGASLCFQENTCIESFYLHIPNPKGILASLLQGQIDKNYLAHFPKNLLALCGTSLNWGGVYDQILELFATLDPVGFNRYQGEYEQITGVLQFDLRRDLLGSLGNQLFFALGSTYPSFPFPEMALSIEVTNGPLFLDCLKKLVKNTQGPLLKTLMYQGLEITYIDLSDPLRSFEGPFQIAVCQVQPNMVLLTLNVNTLKNILNFEPKGSILDKSDFTQLFFQTDSPLVSFSYLELSKGIDVLHGFFTYVVSSRDFRRDLPMLDPALFPSQKVFTEGFPSFLNTLSKTPQGVALKISAPVPFVHTLFVTGGVFFALLR